MAVAVRQQAKAPLWRNATFLKWLAQLFVLGATLALFVLLGSQAFENFSQSGVSFGFDWLTDPTGVDIREGIDTSPDSGIRALSVGIINTLRVTISGIIAATILGTLIGIGRLSHNWIVNKVATVYIETIRNIPLLVQIFFWSALAITLPSLTPDDVGEYWFKASNKGFASSWVFWDGSFWPWLVFVIVGIVVGRYVSRWRHQIQEDTGKPSYPGTFWILTVLLFAIIGWFAWPVLAFLSPVFHWIADLVAGLPPILLPIILAIASLVAAGLWIRNFFESRRTPAGFGKFTDDDWFRIIFAGVSGVLVAIIVFFLAGLTVTTVAGDQVGLPELALVGISNIFDWLGNSFANNGGTPLVFEKPIVELRGAGFVQYGTTGMVMSIPFFAVWMGVTLYTAAFIAEIVRGGILAVSKGQTEAAQAVGLTRGQYLRLIILPQAFRVILPPIGNQYLNLFKNTSLGMGVAFADIVAVGTTIMNQTGQSLPVVLVWMAFFVTGSLTISAIVNYYNRKMSLVER
ncbi:MAG: ABC transporter permease subunit [Actinomycetota bacterium]|nr:ABC transporter permease subunit [Actinomycetota bacterium]